MRVGAPPQKELASDHRNRHPHLERSFARGRSGKPVVSRSLVRVSDKDYRDIISTHQQEQHRPIMHQILPFCLDSQISKSVVAASGHRARAMATKVRIAAT